MIVNPHSSCSDDDRNLEDGDRPMRFRSSSLHDECGFTIIELLAAMVVMGIVGVVIERMHGVRFSQAHVWRILGSLGFSPQKPEKRAIERNEDGVRNWKRNTWPALKKKPSEKAG